MTKIHTSPILKEFFKEPKTDKEKIQYLETAVEMLKQVVDNPKTYIIIQCGYEGIEGLIYLTRDSTQAVAHINAIRGSIITAVDRRNKILEQHGAEKDEDYNDHYDRMHYNYEISEEEYHNAKFRNPDSYCIQKWDGNKFSCVCKELGCETSKQWLM
jgi:hypothetical protein